MPYEMVHVMHVLISIGGAGSGTSWYMVHVTHVLISIEGAGSGTPHVTHVLI